MRLARDLGVAPRRLWGWEPESRLVRDDDGWKLVAEPEFSKEQYELLAALVEYEASIGDHGFPLSESMSVEADPMNPEGSYGYVAKPVRDWAEQAIEDAQKDPQWSGENYSAARKWRVFRVER